MITILGTKITVFALYGLFSLQLCAVLSLLLSYRLRAKKFDDPMMPSPMVLPAIVGVCAEIAVIVWLGNI